MYAAEQQQIDRTKRQDALIVCVIGEHVYFLQELLRYRYEHVEEHPLRAVKRPFVVMSLETFELSVEVSALHDVALDEVLMEFWRMSESMHPQQPTADLFLKRWGEPEPVFAESFAKEVYGGG